MSDECDRSRIFLQVPCSDVRRPFRSKIYLRPERSFCSSFSCTATQSSILEFYPSRHLEAIMLDSTQSCYILHPPFVILRLLPSALRTSFLWTRMLSVSRTSSLCVFGYLDRLAGRWSVLCRRKANLPSTFGLPRQRRCVLLKSKSLTSC